MNISLMITVIAAFATPMILARFNIKLLPTSVAEIIVGIIIGKSCLNLVHIDSILTSMSTFGVILLLFLSGMEIDFSLFKKNNAPLTKLEQKQADDTPKITPVQVAVLAYALSFVAAFALAFLFKFTGLFTNVLLATILFSTIALGVVISVLKENELLSKPFGQTILLIAVLGEVVPLLSLTIYSSVVAGRGSQIWLIGLLFIAGAMIFRHFRWFFPALSKFNKSTTQIDMRLSFAVIITLVVLAEHVGAENILGAFVAGIVIKLLSPSESTQQKLDAIGYGFLIPFFFILTGVKLDIPSLLADSKTIVLIPLFFLAFVLAKLPAFFGLRLRFKRQNALAGSILSGTTITLVLAVLTVAEDLKVITSQQSGAFLIAGILTCLFGPLCFNRLLSSEPEDMKKTTVHIIGANLVTINATERLNSDWYDVSIYTHKQENYDTYRYKGNVSLLTSIDPKDLIDSSVFDTDILVLGYTDPQMNVNLALKAKEYGVKRVICELENTDPQSMSEMDHKLASAGVETLNIFDTNVGLMSAVIETPSTLQMITGNSRLYEVVVNNARFDGIEVSQIPFVENITISRIFRNGRAISPHGSTQIQLGDHILFSCDKDVMPRLRAVLSKMNE